MESAKQRLMYVFGALALAAVAWIVSTPRLRPELTIGTVNNADMILMQRLSKDFEMRTGIHLNWVVLGESVLRQRLTVDIATGGNTFDVVTIGSYETPLWAEQGWLLPVDGFSSEYDYDDIFEVVRQALTYKGRLYAAPLYAESSFTYYRIDLFQKAGLEMPEQPSYEDIRRFAAAVHDPAHNVYGICLRGEPGWGQNMAYLSTLVYTFGGRWMDLDWKPQLTTEPWIRAVSFYVDVMKRYGPPGATTDGHNEMRALFANGNCAIWVDATSAAGYILDPSQSRVAGVTGFAKAPVARFPTGAAWAWSWSLAIPASTRNAAAARQFVKWATSRAYIETVGERFGWVLVPPGTRKSTYDNSAYRRAAPFATLVRDAILSADMRHPSVLPVPYVGIQYVEIPEFQAIGTDVGQEISAALSGRSTVKEALQAAQERAERAMRRGGYLK